MLDARNVYRKVTRKIYDFSPEQMKNLSAIVWLYRGQQSRFLTLMRDYLRQICTKSSAIPENLAAFEGTLSDLRQRFNTPSLLFTARSTSCRCRFSTTTPLDASLQRRRELLAKPAEAAGWALHECFRLLDGPGGNAEGRAGIPAGAPFLGLIGLRMLVPTTTASAAATTAAAAATVAATAAAAWPLLAGLGFVDGQRPAVMFLAVQCGNRRLGFLVAGHFDKAEAFAAAGHLVHDHSGAFDRSVLREHL